MKVSVSSTGSTLDASVDPRFGRCSYFVVVDTDDMSFEAVENNNAALGTGAGVQSAQLVAESGATTVLTGNCGPKAHKTLTAAGIDVVVGCSGTISNAVEQLQAGNLQATDTPNVDSHNGHYGTMVSS